MPIKALSALAILISLLPIWNNYFQVNVQFFFWPFPFPPSRMVSGCLTASNGLRSAWKRALPASSIRVALVHRLAAHPGDIHQESLTSGWKSRKPFPLGLMRGCCHLSWWELSPPGCLLVWHIRLGPRDQCSGRVRAGSPVKPAGTSSYPTLPQGMKAFLQNSL